MGLVFTGTSSTDVPFAATWRRVSTPLACCSVTSTRLTVAGAGADCGCVVAGTGAGTGTAVTGAGVGVAGIAATLLLSGTLTANAAGTISLV